MQCPSRPPHLCTTISNDIVSGVDSTLFVQNSCIQKRRKIVQCDRYIIGALKRNMSKAGEQMSFIYASNSMNE